MSVLDHVVPEFERCNLLRQIDLDRLKAAGIPTMALVQSKFGLGRCLKRARVVLDSSGRRFEFERFSRFHIDADPAFVVLALDCDGQPADLVAWRPDPRGFLASLIGRAPLLGAEQLEMPRLDLPLRVHETTLEWLRHGREGVVVVDPKMAAPALIDAAPLAVSTPAFAVRLRNMLHRTPPRIVVDAAMQTEVA